jgi:hypothetical protein
MRLTWWRGRGLWLLLTTDSTQNAVPVALTARQTPPPWTHSHLYCIEYDAFATG